jgi:hypothetical protein
MSDWRTEPARKARVQQLGDDISVHLDHIRALYKDAVKITLIVRVPDTTERDTVLTDDDPKAAVKALEALWADPTKEVYPR